MTQHNLRTGKIGEQLAQQYLEKQGYTILFQNWRCQFGEIDLIAQYDNLYVAVEVRTRHADSTSFAFESITPSKRDRIIRSVYIHIAELAYPENCRWRIDVIGIAIPPNAPPIIDHMEDALGW